VFSSDCTANEASAGKSWLSVLSVNVLWSSLVSRSITTAEAPPPRGRSVNTVSPVVNRGWPDSRVAARSGTPPALGWKLITLWAGWHARVGPEENTPAAIPLLSWPGGEITVLLVRLAGRLVPTLMTAALESEQSWAKVV
jgi:hypothetical protein